MNKVFLSVIVAVLVGLVIGVVFCLTIKNQSETALPEESVHFYPIRYCEFPKIIYHGDFQKLSDKERYYLQAKIMALQLEVELDAVQPYAWHLWKKNDIKTVKDIKKVLSKEEGVCRHKNSVAFWLIHYLKPKSKIKAMGGYVYRPGLKSNWTDQFDSNHIWTEVDGKIVDVTTSQVYYTPYYEVSLTKGAQNWMVLEYNLNYRNIERQYKCDRKKCNITSPYLPWEDPKNKQRA